MPDDLRSAVSASAVSAAVVRFARGTQASVQDSLAVEEPLEFQLTFGPKDDRQTKSISVTMRTPGHDAELIAGFMLTEGILSDASGLLEIVSVASPSTDSAQVAALEQDRQLERAPGPRNIVQVSVDPAVNFNLATLQRNFYTTSSCGICGKASLLALRTVCPPRAANRLEIGADVLLQLPGRMREGQSVFEKTGGLHACGLFTAAGELLALREDVGRHNALDKLIGAEFLADRVPLRNRILMLSGRASFELLQKSVMAGISMVASVGAPSSLAVQVAREFDVTLVGFLRAESFNVYHGAERILSAPGR